MIVNTTILITPKPSVFVKLKLTIYITVEWSCLVSFTEAQPSYDKREASEKLKMKNICRHRESNQGHLLSKLALKSLGHADI